MIEPLFDGRNVLEELARLTKFETSSPYEIVRRSFRKISGVKEADFEAAWRMFLHEGTSPAGAYALERPELKWDKVAQALTAAGPGPAAPSSANLELVFDRDAKIDDGRYANNGWLQEFSNPITKLAWGNAALLSPKTAGELGVVDGDVIRLELDGRSLEIPAMLLPGQADYSVGVSLGYGRIGVRPGRPGRGLQCLHPANLQGAGYRHRPEGLSDRTPREPGRRPRNTTRWKDAT